MEGIIKRFNQRVDSFKKTVNQNSKSLLEFETNIFDRDFVQFNVDVSAIETDLQGYIDKNFDSVTLVDDSLTLLRKFLSILKRDSLKQSIYNKYTVIF